MGKIKEVDSTALKGSMAKRSEEEKSILKYILTGAAWASEKLHAIGRKQDDLCELCGEKEADVRHTLWDCKAIHGDARGGNNQIRKCLPTNLQYGIPGIMTKELDGSFWGL
eukprot:5596902-Karenia_brevis.AAC.1